MAAAVHELKTYPTTQPVNERDPKEMLLAPLPQGATSPPHTDEEVNARGINYYGGFAGTPVLTSAARAEQEDESSHIQHH